MAAPGSSRVPVPAGRDEPADDDHDDAVAGRASASPGTTFLRRLARLRYRARFVKRSNPGQAVAVIGLGSRAIVYGSLAALVVELALATGRMDTDQGSALASLGTSTAGSVLLVALVVGVACYTTWRWAEAWLGSADGDRSRRNRILAVIEGTFYLPFGYLALTVLTGNPGRAEQGRQYRSTSARLLDSGVGRTAVLIVGLVVIGVGVFFVAQGVRRSFAAHFDFPRHQRWVRPTVLVLGSIGSVARGLIFAEAGVLVVYAAIADAPRQAGGVDAALDQLRRQSLGTGLLLAAAVGFASFAVFALAEAAWRNR